MKKSSSRNTPIEELLDKLGLRPAEDFESVLELAKRIHRSRVKSGNSSTEDALSRTSIFAACLRLEPRLLKLMKSAGLRFGEFMEAVGASRVRKGAAVEWPTDVSSNLSHGLDMYAGRFQARPVDAWALAFAIVSVAGDVFARRFEEAGGALPAAQEVLADALHDSGSSRPNLVDLTRWKLEPHVERAFHLAWASAGGRPVEAADLLLAAVRTGTQHSSQSFHTLASLLGRPAEPASKASPLFSSADDAPSSKERAPLHEYPLSESLAAAYSVAEEFFRERGAVWGRDFVTFGLLADDPSLADWKELGAATLSDVRAKWYRFLTSSTGHREPDDWERWWTAAGVPLPDDGDTSFVELWKDLDQALQTELARVVKARWDGRPIDGALSVVDVALAVAQVGPGAPLSDAVLQTLGFAQSETPGALWNRLGLEPDLTSSILEFEPAEFDDDARQVLQHARELQAADEKDPHIGVAGLAAAVLHAARSNADDRGRALLELFPGADQRARDVGRELASVEAEGRLTEDERAVWLRAFPAPRPTEHFDTIEFADDWVEFDGEGRIDDHLGFRPAARRLATLLAAPVPRDRENGDGREDAGERDSILRGRRPIAIGLFGAWGSGKSTFMRLMREELDSIRASGATFYGLEPLNVRKIYFNAWHYADADLWASLGAHIFEQLSKRDGEVEENEVAEALANLHRELASSERGLERAKRTREDAARRRAEAEEGLRKSRRRVEADQRSLFETTVGILGKIETSFAKEDGKAALDSVRDVAQAAGIPFEGRSAEDLAELTRRLRANASASRVLLSDIGKLLRRPWHAIVAALLVAALCIGAVAVGRELWASGGLLTTLVAGWSAALARLHRAKERAQGLLGALQDPARVPSTSDARKAVSNASKQLQDAEAELAQTQAQLDGAQDELEDAEGRLAHIEGGGLVYDFAAERAGTDGYGGRLGVVSSLRRDFDRLDQLLSGYGRRHGEREGDEAATAEAQNAKRPPVAERVVLFIDDLDRCDPSRVVEVLQAVHLLLAFPLFSVVVAVDPRWLEWSLEEAYGRRDRIGRVRASPVFSPQDYLQKIFQIPFSLQGMDEGGFGRLVESVLKREDDEEATPETVDEDAGAEDVVTDPDVPAEVADEADEPAEDDSVEPPQATPSEADDEPVDEEPQLSTEQLEAQERRAAALERQEEATKQRRRFKALAVPQNEREFLMRLHPFLATPRETKRFLNIYRLLRVQAGEVSPAYLERFASLEDGGDHRAALFLLALQSGFPNLGPTLLKRLHVWWLEAGRKTKVSMPGEGRSEDGLFLVDEWQALLDLLMSTDDAAHWRREELQLDVPGVPDSELAKERERLRRAVDRVVASFDGEQPWPADIFPYAAWAGPVGRFSFGWNLPRSGRGDGWSRRTRTSSEEEDPGHPGTGGAMP